MRVLVVIVTYNAMRWLDRCIGSLLASNVKVSIFVVDNCSCDGTPEYIHEHYPDVILLRNRTNLGFGKANNIGLQYALDEGYDYVYLLNQDAWIQSDTLECLIATSQTHKEYGILSPLQMEANMLHLDKNFKRSVCSWESCPQLLDGVIVGPRKEVYEVQTLMAAHWFMTNACIKAVGGFSPAFPHYGEDYNYLDRVHMRGIKVGIVPSLMVVHDREYREDTAEKLMYKRHITAIGLLSSPNPTSNRWLRVINILLTDILRYHTFTPLQYFLQIVNGYSTIKKYRRESMLKDCAFLMPSS
ncbi:MAG: glycosyltransferase family 2 protein [Prevotella sp.]|nr:glycosyltransferase family 2 protein [Prevotella sp.]